MDKDTKEVIDTLNVILEKMATKDELAGLATKDDIRHLDGRIDGLREEMHEGFASIRGEIRDLRSEIREIHSRLDAIEAELRNHAGYAKEIDHLFQRVAAIEKHLGLKRTISA